jgi:hypothetical protein
MQHNDQAKSISDRMRELREWIIDFTKKNYDQRIIHNFKEEPKGHYAPWSSDPPDIASVKEFLNYLQNAANLVDPKQGPYLQFRSMLQAISDYYKENNRPSLPVHVAAHLQALPSMKTLLTLIPMARNWMGNQEPSSFSSAASVIGAQPQAPSQSIALTALETIKERAYAGDDDTDSTAPILDALQNAQKKMESFVRKLPFEKQKEIFDSYKEDGTYKIQDADTSGVRGIKSLLNSVAKLQSALQEWRKLKDKNKFFHPLSAGSVLLDVKNVIDSFKAIADLDPTDELYGVVKTLLIGIRPFMQDMTVQIDQLEGRLGLKEGVLLTQVTPLIELFESTAEIAAAQTNPRFPFWESRLEMRNEQFAAAKVDQRNADLLAGMLMTRGYKDGEYYPHDLKDLPKDDLEFIKQNLHLLPLKPELLEQYTKLIDARIDVITEFPKAAVNSDLKKLHERITKEASTLSEKMQQRVQILDERITSAERNYQAEQHQQNHKELNLNATIREIALQGTGIIMSSQERPKGKSNEEIVAAIEAQLSKPATRRAILTIADAIPGELSENQRTRAVVDFIKSLIQRAKDGVSITEKINQKFPDIVISVDMQSFISGMTRINSGEILKSSAAASSSGSSPKKESCSTGLMRGLFKQNNVAAEPENQNQVANKANFNVLPLIIQARKQITEFIKSKYDEQIFKNFEKSAGPDRRYESSLSDSPDIAACKSLLNLLSDVSNVLDGEQTMLTRYKSVLHNIQYFLGGGLDADKDNFLTYIYQQTSHLKKINPVLVDVIRDCELLVLGSACIARDTVRRIADSYSAEPAKEEDSSSKLAGQMLNTALGTLARRQSESSEEDREQSLFLEITQNIRKSSASPPVSPLQSNKSNSSSSSSSGASLPSGEEKEIPLLKLLTNMSAQTQKYIGSPAASSAAASSSSSSAALYAIEKSDSTDKRGAKLLANSIAYLQKAVVGWEKIKDKQKVFHPVTTAEVLSNIKSVVEELSKIAGLDKRTFGDLYKIVQVNLDALRPILIDFAKLLDQAEGQFRFKEGVLFSQFESVFESYEKAAKIAEVQNGSKFPFWAERVEARRLLLTETTQKRDGMIVDHDKLLEMKKTLGQFENTPLENIPLEKLRYLKENLPLLELDADVAKTYQSFLDAAIQSQDAIQGPKGWVSSAMSLGTNIIKVGRNVLEAGGNLAGITVHSQVVDKANEMVVKSEKLLAAKGEHINALEARVASATDAKNHAEAKEYFQKQSSLQTERKVSAIKKIANGAINEVISSIPPGYEKESVAQKLNHENVKNALTGLAGAMFKDSIPNEAQFYGFTKSLLKPKMTSSAIRDALNNVDMKDEMKATLATVFSGLNAKSLLDNLQSGICLYIKDNFPKKAEKYAALFRDVHVDNMQSLEPLIERMLKKSWVRKHPDLVTGLTELKHLSESQKTAMSARNSGSVSAPAFDPSSVAASPGASYRR